MFLIVFFPLIFDDSLVLHHFDGVESPVVAGDLFVMSATDKEDGDKFLFASFHGDTNGLATLPVITAVHNYTKTVRPNHKLLFGMFCLFSWIWA